LILKGKNFKSTFFIKNPIHAPLDFCPNVNHSVVRFSTEFWQGPT